MRPFEKAQGCASCEDDVLSYLRACFFHEAGHVVVSLAIGVPVRRVVLDLHGEQPLAKTLHYSGTRRARSDRDIREHDIVAFGGYFAERLTSCGHRARAGAEDDLHSVHEAGKALIHGFSFRTAEIDMFEFRCCLAAARLVKLNEALIEHLATEFVDAGEEVGARHLANLIGSRRLRSLDDQKYFAWCCRGEYVKRRRDARHGA